MSERVFVLGLDGCRLEFLDRPELPNFRRLINENPSGTLFSRPALTPAAWTSMVTGVNPGKHGIFDFRVGEKLFWATDKKMPELWDYAKSVVINVPMTYPAKPIDGTMVSGMMSPDLDSDLVHPESERSYLHELGYVIEADPDLQIIEESIRRRLEMITKYIERDWELFFVVFREFDVIHHFFWGQDLNYYKLVDEYLGDVLIPWLDRFGVKLAIVSDHGFAQVDKSVNIEKLLEEKKLNDFYEVGGWGALYVKPDQHLTSEEQKQAVSELKSYQHQGEQVLDVYTRSELYSGPYAELGPDLLVWPKREKGYTFSMHSADVITSSSPKNGCHLEHGMVLLRGFSEETNNLDADIKDIFPTVIDALGLDIPAGIDGKKIY